MSQKLLQKLNKKTNIIGGMVRLLLSATPSSPQTPRSKAGGFSFTENDMYGKKPKPAKKPMKPAKPGKYAPKK